MWGCRWLTWSLVGFVSLGASTAQAQDEPAEASVSEVDERPQKPPIELVQSGPFKIEDKRGYRNMVVVGPRLLPPGLGGRYIRSVSDHVSVMVGGGYSGWELFGATLRHVDARAGIDYQPIGNGLDGMYIGPRAVYRSFLGSVGDAGVETKTMGVGAVVGWRAIFDPGLALGAGVGGVYTTWLGSFGDLEEEDIEITGTAPLFELTVGFAF
jgi:hypothetical protein